VVAGRHEDRVLAEDDLGAVHERGCKNIFVMNANGSGVTQLTFESNDGRDNTAPSWSPDGQWIAYGSNHDGYKDVFKVPAAGGSPIQLTNAIYDDFVPDWSPHGSKIVIGAVVYFLRLVVWIVDDFTVDRYRDRLFSLHKQIRRDGHFVAHAARFLVEAEKPSGRPSLAGR
jgi:dipeptidyl aminopeptidase/acylaminoacyl peptidase